jgi:hypothetical protein
MRLVILACFKLLSPFLPSPSSESSVNSIPVETLRACQIFTKLVDLNYGASAQDRPSLLTMVRFVLAVRNGDGIAAQKYACSLLIPSGAAIDPFRCYDSVRLILLASNMTSELCDVLSSLLQSCKSSGQAISKDIFEHVFSANLDCARLAGPGGALQLLFDHPSIGTKEHFERIIHRSITLRRFDVLRDSAVSQVNNRAFLFATRDAFYRLVGANVFALTTFCSMRSTFSRTALLINGRFGLIQDFMVIASEKIWFELRTCESQRFLFVFFSYS